MADWFQSGVQGMAALVCRHEGSFCVAGTGPKGLTPAVEDYDDTTDTWTRARRIPFPHRAVFGSFDFNCFGHAFGGDSAVDIGFLQLETRRISSNLRFYPSETWCYMQEFIDDMTGIGTGENSGSSSFADIGYTIGGFGNGGRTRNIWGYYPTADVWFSDLFIDEVVFEMAVDHLLGTLMGFGGNGGFGGPFILDWIWKITPTFGIVTELVTTLGFGGRDNDPACESISNKSYIMYGRTGDGPNFQAKNEEYALTTDTLSVMTTPPTPGRIYPGHFQRRDMIYIFGGQDVEDTPPDNREGLRDDVLQYNSATDVWTTMSPLKWAAKEDLWGVIIQTGFGGSPPDPGDPIDLAQRSGASGMTVAAGSGQG